MGGLAVRQSEPYGEGVEIIARGLLQVGPAVLLCRSKRGGYSYLPGGHVERDETAVEACRREFLEETGMAVRVGKCLLVCEVLFEQNRTARHEVNLVFHVEHEDQGRLDDEKIRALVSSQEEHIAFDWVDLAAIGDLDLRPTSIRAWLVAGAQREGTFFVPTPH